MGIKEVVDVRWNGCVLMRDNTTECISTSPEEEEEEEGAGCEEEDEGDVAYWFGLWGFARFWEGGRG